MLNAYENEFTYQIMSFQTIPYCKFFPKILFWIESKNYILMKFGHPIRLNLLALIVVRLIGELSIFFISGIIFCQRVLQGYLV